MRIEQYIQLMDYALWEVIENGATLPKIQVVEGVTTVMPVTSVADKAQRRLEVKAGSTLMMGISNEHQLKFNSIKDAKQLLEAIEKRFENGATLPKIQVVEGVTTVMPVTSVADKAQRRLEVKAGSTLMMGISNEHQLKFNSIKDAKQLLEAIEKRFEVKGISSSNSNTQNVAFMSSTNSSINGAVDTAQTVNTANGVSTASTQVNDDFSTNIDKLSDAVIYAFLASQTNSPQLAHEDLEQIHPDDMENEQLLKDLKKSELMVLGYKTDIAIKELRRKLKVAQKEKVGIQLTIDKLENASKGVNKLIKCHIVENCKKRLGYKSYNAVPPPYTGNFMPPKLDLSYTSLDEFAVKLVVENKSSKEETKEVRKNTDALIIEEWVSGNMSYLIDYEEIDGGYVAFKGNPKGGKITGKCKIKTGNLDFKNVYFVRELKFNLSSVSQMCDKKNSVLFSDTKCIVLSPNIKLIDESQVLLRVPRKNNMYSVDLKNIVPKGGLTCVFAKSTSDESKLWHRSKADKGLFVGYSFNSKAFRVFNSITRIVEEHLHIRFSENTPNVVGSGPYWLFDIDSLTRTMNYEPIVAGIQFNSFAGTKASDNAGQARKETQPVKDYILLPLWTANPPFSKDPKSSQDDGFKPLSNDGRSSTDNVVGTNKDNELSFDLNMPALEDVGTFNFLNEDEDDDAVADMNNLDTTIQAIGTKWVFMNKKDERGIVIRNKARLVTQGNTQEERIDYDEVIAPVVRIEAIRLFLAYALFKDFVVYQMNVKSAFLYEKIKEEVYVCQLPGFEDPDFLDRVYKVENHCIDYIKLLKHEVKNASTPMETQKPLLKDEDGEEVDVHIVNIRKLTLFGYQVNLKVSHLYAIKRIFRYLKGQPKIGLWYLKDSPFDLTAYTNSDYARASLDRKSTTGGCQFLGCRLISWQCKKQTLVANSITEAEYVAALSCCRQVLWIQNQLLDYGRDLRLADEEGVDCLLNSTIFENLELMGTVASSIICLATTQKFNFSKLIFDSMIKNLDNVSGKFLMYPRLVRVSTTAFSLEAEHDCDEQSVSEDASKQERKINDIDADEDITLVNDQDDAKMFDVNDLHGEEVFVKKGVVDKEVSAAGEVNAASIATTVSAAATITTDEITLAQALVEIKTSKPKAKGVFIQEPSESITTTTSLKKSQDKGKAIMIEEPLKPKKKVQLMFDEEAALKLVNTYVDFRTELVEGSSKRAGEELTQESAKKQNVDDDKETTKLKELMEIIPDKEELAIDAIPLAVNSLKIVD
nr:ribonuclease H-like domain, reverse transcriptase, RNA-dependent DNA polymerase [Tanacetum cinerariifolium]